MVAVTGLIFAITQRIVATPVESAERGVEKPDPSKQPTSGPTLAEIPPGVESTAAARFVRMQAEPEFVELKDNVAELRATQCILMRELRKTRARLAVLEGGKRGKEAKAELEADTVEWNRCPVLTGNGKRQELGSLDEAADSALRR
ncbi:MAG TPA: hypothetical protein VK509_07555 [Polyangiales bacterium]|nr:hypothetical protein [Polyangiales bacterium]